MSCDLKLTGGHVIDGSGTPAIRADIAVNDGVITDVGDLDGLEADVVIDCSGKTITPGFIDIHSHSDWLVPGGDHGQIVEPFVRQGMTTIVGGNCGFSPAPITDVNRAATQDASRLIIDGEIHLRWRTMGEFLDALEADGVSLNIAQLVGHGSVRAGVSGPLNMAAPTGAELKQMEKLTRASLDAGCCGVSTGLGYPPGIFAQEEELTQFARWAAQSDKIFTSHLKAYSWISGVYQTDASSEPHNHTAIKEILRVAEAARARLQISHLIFVGRLTWANHVEAIRLIEDAQRRGLDVAFDAFPYTAGNTTASVLFPPEILPRLEEVLQNEEERNALASFAEMTFAMVGLNLGDIQIMNANAPALNKYNGLRITRAAEREGMSAFDFYGRLVVDSHRTARVLIHTYSGDNGEEEPLRAVLRHPLCTIETDTFVTHEGHQNPASYGTFPRALSTYVKEGLFTLEEAVYRMTGAPAERLHWKQRGWVKKGCAADLVVLDLGQLQDTATFAEPRRFPEGIEHVFINGRHVLDGQEYDAASRAGQVLRQ
jgi:N-acyl-D-aspartate/D-glutamate deacylase